MKKLYPCVSYFDEKTEYEIKKLQEELFEITGSRTCLDEWRPHITIGSTVELDLTIDKFVLNWRVLLWGKCRLRFIWKVLGL